ncbi:MAG: lipocalin-like domain-containing protein [Trichodesmium sp. MAG_R02]|jgi:hypothetical protein|nr:lipocalin-like domain-containing protein [Trichodesmium sp. MAG_R02]
MTQGTEMTDSTVVKDAIVGTWKLVEMKCVDEEGNISYPYGQDPVSYIIYTEEGHMSFSIMMSNRLKMGLLVQEIMDMGYGRKPTINIFKYLKAGVRYLQAVQKYVGYMGKYEIKDNKVIHHIEITVVPDLIGIDVERTLEISGDTLVLTGTYPQYRIDTTCKRVS